MFCCRAFSRTLTYFLLYTLSIRGSVTIIPFVRFYFELSAATDNVFLCYRVAVLIPCDFCVMMWDHEALQSVDCFKQFLESFVLLSSPDDKGPEEHQKCT